MWRPAMLGRMSDKALGYWGPALIVVGLLAGALFTALLRDMALYWSVVGAAAVAIAGLVLLAYKRIR